MIRRALRWVGVGIILIAATLFVLEFVMSNYVFPQVTTAKWVLLAAAVILVLWPGHNTEVTEQHLPH